MSRKVRVTITLEAGLAAFVDRRAKRTKACRSKVIADIIEGAERAEVEARMAEGYRQCAAENLRVAESCLPAQAEVVLRDE
ncbi:MAG: CopG family transcriptional regulator [Firmicutes bacterium]|nr:CopG family transcriptional regulator [Bacillota bacterium]